MTRVFLLVSLFLLISIELLGQCVNSPTVTLGSTSGSTCGVTSVAITGNTFGGSATKVTITENGAGSVSPTSATKSPFTFTYTTKKGDDGKKVIITITTDNPLGLPCAAAKATYTLTVNTILSTPAVGTITRPTCAVATGSVLLSGLPSSGTWTLTRSPGGITTTGTGTSVTISGLAAGTYNYTVTSSEGCTSSASSNVVIPAQPVSPASPVQTVDCALGSGKATVKVTSPTGTGLTYSRDGGAYQSGTSFSNVADGSHSITVKNSSGCTTTGVSFQVSCGCSNPPIVGVITQPTCSVATGSAELSGLPASGTWTLTRTPDGVTTTGTGTGTTISGLAAGTYTFAVTNAAGCVSGASASVVINAQSSAPTAPVIVTVTQPTCTVSTGSVILSGLPSTGTWTLIRSPGNVTITGSGTNTTIPILSEGTYTYSVTNSAGCVSPVSANIVITAQPQIPGAPIVGSITAPTCSLSTGSVVLNGLPGTGTWILTRYPGTVTSSGTGTSITLSDLPGGTYNFTLTNASGCASVMSASVIIPAQPGNLLPPVIGIVTQPVSELPTGSVVLNGLPESGSWILTLTPGNIATSGTGITKTISGLAAGIYSFTVTNSSGCTSGSSASFEIYVLSGNPALVITNPAPVCFPTTADLTDPGVTAGSTLNLTYSYWADSATTIQYGTPGAATAGTYFIKGTTAKGLSSVKPVSVLIFRIPLANAGPDQVLNYLFGTSMDAELSKNNETGIWSVISGTGEFFDPTFAKTSVSRLSLDKNIFLWTVSNGACPASYDTVNIIVHDLVIPTLITPNMDGKNDYLVIKGSEALGRIELVIFDRRGTQVYKNGNYDNSWNGLDLNGNPLSTDTYFYVLKTENNRSLTGYVVIRR